MRAAAAGRRGRQSGGKAQVNKPKRGSRSAFADASDFAHLLEEAADENEGVNPKLAAWEGGQRRGGADKRAPPM